MPASRLALGRTLLIAATACGLAACAAQQEASNAPAAGAAVSAEPAPAAQPSPPAAAPTLPAGRAARAPSPPPAEPQPPLTITKAREQCWMQAETNRVRDLDARLKIVEKCVDQKMNASIGR